MRRNSKGFNLVEMMIVVAIIALLASIAIPNLLRARVNSSEASAQAALKTIATALENYVAINSTYPPNTTALLGAIPPYINQDYFTGAYNGYTFSAGLSSYTYSVTAFPSIGSSITAKTYTITTGGLLSEI